MYVLFKTEISTMEARKFSSIEYPDWDFTVSEVVNLNNIL